MKTKKRKLNNLKYNEVHTMCIGFLIENFPFSWRGNRKPILKLFELFIKDSHFKKRS